MSEGKGEIMKKLWIGMAALALTAGVLSAERLRFVVDPAHTSVTFKVKHMAISTVTGTFEKVEGWIELDPKDPTTARAEGIVYVNSINTRNAKRDAHLKSDDFFAAERYPTMKMVLKKVYKKGDQWWADVDLTIRGITKTVSFPFTLMGPITDPWGNRRIAVEASFTIDRFDFGLKWNKALETGALVAGRRVKVDLAVEAVHRPE